MCSIFYGRQIPTEVFFLLPEEKNKDKNLNAGCRREIWVIRGFDDILTENLSTL